MKKKGLGRCINTKLIKPELMKENINFNFNYEFVLRHGELGFFIGDNSIERIVVKYEDGSYTLWFKPKTVKNFLPLYSERGEIRKWRDFTRLIKYLKDRFDIHDKSSLTLLVTC